MKNQEHIGLVLMFLVLVTIACAAAQTTGHEPSVRMECTLGEIRGRDVVVEKPVIARNGGVTYKSQIDAKDYNTTTRPNGGDWLNETNAGDGTYQVVDLGKEYTLTGIGYSIDWDGAYANPLTFRVVVSTDQVHWVTVSNVIHRHVEGTGSNWVDMDREICPVKARYVKYEEPPDEEWNGWGNYFQLRAYAEDED